jgi:hypothetical protein
MAQGTASGDGWNTFDVFVPNSYGTCTYGAPEIVLGMDTLCRAHGEITSQLGAGVVSGSANPSVLADWRTLLGSYQGFQPWTVGDITAYAVKMELQLTTSVGLAYISDFVPTIDAEERTEYYSNVAIALGGTAVTFARSFKFIPGVQATPVGASSIVAVISNVTTTGCTITLYNPATGSSVAGAVNWQATGV